MSENIAFKIDSSMDWFRTGDGHYLKGTIYKCSCGFNHKSYFRGDFECPKCQTTKLIYLDREYKSKVVETDIEVIDKHMKGFHLAKNKYRAVFHKDDTITLKHLGKIELIYTFVDGFKMINEDKEEVYPDHRIVNKFLGFIFNSKSKFKELVGNDVNKGLYDFAYEHFYKRTRRYYSHERSIGYSLEELSKHKYLEILYFGGFTDKNILSDFVGYRNNLAMKETKPHKILQVEKVMLPLIKEMNRYSPYNLKEIRALLNLIGGNNFKTVFKILMEENNINNVSSITNFCSYFSQMYEAYKYTNVERLATYVCRDIKLQQGIDDPSNGLQYLRDYVRMMTDLGYDYEKYSKSLKKDHDIANMNYKILGDKVFSKRLAEKVKEEGYKLLQQKGKEYSIVIPEESDDVVKEGQSLSHCVASYVKDIARGLCKIVFLRQTEKLDESCVTIEVRGNAVRQVRGKGNRKPTEDEVKFVEAWAKKKELILAY